MTIVTRSAVWPSSSTSAPRNHTIILSTAWSGRRLWLLSRRSYRFSPNMSIGPHFVSRQYTSTNSCWTHPLYSWLTANRQLLTFRARCDSLPSPVSECDRLPPDAAVFVANLRRYGNACMRYGGSLEHEFVTASGDWRSCENISSHFQPFACEVRTGACLRLSTSVGTSGEHFRPRKVYLLVPPMHEASTGATTDRLFEIGSARRKCRQTLRVQESRWIIAAEHTQCQHNSVVLFRIRRIEPFKNKTAQTVTRWRDKQQTTWHASNIRLTSFMHDAVTRVLYCWSFSHGTCDYFETGLTRSRWLTKSAVMNTKSLTPVAITRRFFPTRGRLPANGSTRRQNGRQTDLSTARKKQQLHVIEPHACHR